MTLNNCWTSISSELKQCLLEAGSLWPRISKSKHSFQEREGKLLRIKKQRLHTSQEVPEMDKIHTVLEVTEAIKQFLERRGVGTEMFSESQILSCPEETLQGLLSCLHVRRGASGVKFLCPITQGGGGYLTCDFPPQSYK